MTVLGPVLSLTAPVVWIFLFAFARPEGLRCAAALRLPYSVLGKRSKGILLGGFENLSVILRNCTKPCCYGPVFMLLCISDKHFLRQTEKYTF